MNFLDECLVAHQIDHDHDYTKTSIRTKRATIRTLGKVAV